MPRNGDLAPSSVQLVGKTTELDLRGDLPNAGTIAWWRLTTTDIENKADYKASSTSVGVGGGSNGKEKGISGVGVGVGSDEGPASSVTTAGISGIAGNTAIRSTDAEAGIARIFEKERVQKEIEAQTKITEMFGREASKAIGDYAATQMKIEMSFASTKMGGWCGKSLESTIQRLTGKPSTGTLVKMDCLDVSSPSLSSCCDYPTGLAILRATRLM